MEEGRGEEESKKGRSEKKRRKSKRERERGKWRKEREEKEEETRQGRTKGRYMTRRLRVYDED